MFGTLDQMTPDTEIFEICATHGHILSIAENAQDALKGVFNEYIDGTHGLYSNCLYVRQR